MRFADNVSNSRTRAEQAVARPIPLESLDLYVKFRKDEESFRNMRRREEYEREKRRAPEKLRPFFPEYHLWKAWSESHSLRHDPRKTNMKAYMLAAYYRNKYHLSES